MIKLINCGSRPWQYLCGYWGVSFLVNKSILFDTFNKFSHLSKNLHRFNVDAIKINNIVISHNHYDHIGGLTGFINEYKNINVYFSENPNSFYKVSNIIINNDILQLDKNIYIINITNNNTKEQSLVIKTKKGLIVLVGCSHPGIVDIVKTIKDKFNDNIYALIGGFHLMNKGYNEIKNIAYELKNHEITIVAPTHCSGFIAERIFKNIFPDGFLKLTEGNNYFDNL
jgi:7,8-dihydropterin-6-yl-methyl-4-(beta-D-ribofuranosyl)aminobenzene 5'-phosphate synthase